MIIQTDLLLGLNDIVTPHLISMSELMVRFRRPVDELYPVHMYRKEDG